MKLCCLKSGAITHISSHRRKQLVVDAINKPGSIFTMDEMGCYDLSRPGVWHQSEAVFLKPHTVAVNWGKICDDRHGTSGCEDVLRVRWFSHTMWDLDEEMYGWCDVRGAEHQDDLVTRYKLMEL